MSDITLEMAENYLRDQAENRSNNASNKDRKNLLAMWNKGKKTLHHENTKGRKHEKEVR